jgi:hypothetical protein
MQLATLQRAGKVRTPRHVRRSARTRGRRAWQRCLTGGLRPAVRLLWVLGRALAPYEAPTHSVGLLCSFPPPRSFGRVRRSPGAPADRAGPLSMCDGGDVCAQARGRGVPGPPRAQLRLTVAMGPWTPVVGPVPKLAARAQEPRSAGWPRRAARCMGRR